MLIFFVKTEKQNYLLVAEKLVHYAIFQRNILLIISWSVIQNIHNVNEERTFKL